MGSSDSTLASTTKASNVRRNPCVKQSKSKLYADRVGTGDVTFIVESSEYYQTSEIRAHRCVLAALSPKYKTQFYGVMASHQKIVMPNITDAAFLEFLQFFYLDEVTLTMKNIETVLNLAQQSLVEDLVTECTHFLLDMVALDKLTWCYRLALLYQIKDLRDFCEAEISSNIKRVFETDDFLTCDLNIVNEILKLDSLNCTEMEVFEACIAWARLQSKRILGNEPKGAGLRDALGDAVYEIRFCTMTIEEFASIHKTYAGFFKSTESDEIIHGIGKVEDFKNCIFNNKPREPNSSSSGRFKQNLLMKNSAECEIRRSDKAMREPNDCDTIAFICDKPIQLNGFSVCETLRNPDDLDLMVDLKLGSRILQNHPIQKQGLAITFEEPVDIMPHERCFITLKSKVFAEKKMIGHYVRSEVMNDSIWFQFPSAAYGDKSTKLIISLLYKKIE